MAIVKLIFIHPPRLDHTSAIIGAATMDSHSPGRRAVLAALAGNLAIAAIKFAAAVSTGSSAMLSEGVHSLVDSVNELLLLYGMRRAATPPDREHPFGHGREVYFWSLIVALLVLGLGAGVSLLEGIYHLQHPEPIESPRVAYLVLAFSFASEVGSLVVGLRAFREEMGKRGFVETFRRTKDPTTFTVVFEDLAAVIGLAIAGAGIGAAQIWNAPQFDGAASIGIALVLAVSSILMARETKDLLIGEAAHPEVRDSILRIAAEASSVQSANGLFAVHVGPRQVVASLSLEFRDELSSNQIEDCVNWIEAAVKRAHPEVVTVFVKPETRKSWVARTENLSEHED
jgi:cation diffusion facilitator family transporter